MIRQPRRWGYWTRAKLAILAEYLNQFTTASKSVSERVYLDAFAGEGVGVDRLTSEEFAGSVRIALETSDHLSPRSGYSSDRPRPLGSSNC